MPGSKIQRTLSFTSVSSRCNVATHSGPAGPAAFRRRGRPRVPVHCNQRMIGVNNVYRRGHDWAPYASPFQGLSSSELRLNLNSFPMQRPDQYLRPRVKVGRYSRLRVVDMWAARGNEAPGNREVNGHHEQGRTAETPPLQTCTQQTGREAR